MACYAHQQRLQTRHRQVSTCAQAPLLGRRRALLLHVALPAPSATHKHHCSAQALRRRRALHRRCSRRAMRRCHHHRRCHHRRHHGAWPQAVLYQAASPSARAACLSLSLRRAPAMHQPCETTSGTPTELPNLTLRLVLAPVEPAESEADLPSEFVPTHSTQPRTGVFLGAFAPPESLNRFNTKLLPNELSPCIFGERQEIAPNAGPPARKIGHFRGCTYGPLPPTTLSVGGGGGSKR